MTIKPIKLTQFLGSIKLAVPLLVAIAVILIGATFYESEVGSAVVQKEIYKSPWFGGLMFLLALNLGLSTLSRYPWRGARKIGFAITHWGLVVIIAGSAAVIHLSVEGMLLAHSDGGAVSTLRVEGDLLEVAMPGAPVEQASLFIKPDGTVAPAQVGGLSLLSYSNNTFKAVHFEEGGQVDNPAVRLVLKSDRMNQTLERWLAVAPTAYRHIDIGPADLQIVKANTQQDLAKALAPPDQTAQASRLGELTIDWQGRSERVNIEKNLNQPTELRAKGKTLTLEITDFWPDFRLDGDRTPTSASQQLRNPAVQLTLSEHTAQGNDETSAIASYFVFGNPNFSPIRTQVSGEPIAANIGYAIATNTGPDAFFRVVVDADGNLHYAAKSSKGFSTGSLTVGEAITPGWADFEITLAEVVSHAQVKREIVPLPENSPGQGEPALQVAAAGIEPVWVPWGEPTTVNSLEGDAFVAFSPKLLELPFSLKLNDFIIERNEGSESVAMWTSAISLIDPHAGEQVERRVWMNHPTWFKGWKIAQASWNPGDLKQSTLQIKREPWWVTGLTWLGSSMVTTGVATMFYGRSVAKKFKQASAWVGLSERKVLETLVEEAANEPETVSIPLLNVFSGR